MKNILLLVALAGVCFGPTLSAAEEARALSSLPATVFLITEPVPNGAPGQAAIYEISRMGKNMGAAFSDKTAAETFLAALPDAKNHARVVASVPQSFVADTLKMGAAVLLDPTSVAEGGAVVTPDTTLEDNPELKAIHDADQADRKPEGGKPIDWAVVAPRDVARIARVKSLYQKGKLNTGADYFRAALVLHHGATPEDYLLAHELAVVALKKGGPNVAIWLVAATEDRFLQSIGRAQRFGTQLTEPIVVDGAVTDRLRGELNVPSMPASAQQSSH